jgi:hypothetical protein
MIKEDKPSVREIAVGITQGFDPRNGSFLELPFQAQAQIQYKLLWFVQVFGPPTEDGEDFLIEDYEGTSRGKVLDVLSEYSDRTDPYTNAVYDQVVLDLDPGEINRLSFVSREVAEAVTVVSDLEYAMKNQEQ